MNFLVVAVILCLFEGGSVGQTTEPEPFDTTPTAETETPSGTDTADSTPEPWIPPVNNNSDARIFEELIPTGYNKFEIPKDTDYGSPPLLVHVFLRIHSVLEIDEERERVTLDADVEVYWRDYYMLKYGKRSEKGKGWRSVDPKLLDYIWQPDIYVEGMLSSTKAGLMGVPAHLRLRSSFGQMSYKFRLSPVIKCAMEFGYYPADVQNCSFTLRSYAYSYNDVELHWYGGNGVFLHDPSDPNFDLQVANTSRSRVVYTRTYQGTGYDTLHFTVLTRRKLSYHIVQTYVPSTLFVGITWLCFLLPAHMTEARIGITMTTLLTLTAMFGSVRESTPTVSYVKAIDVWMACCICFVFVILLQFSISVWIRSVLNKKEKCENSPTPYRNEQSRGSGLSSEESVALRACAFFDRLSILIYALGFLIFSIVYWNWMLGAGRYFDWAVNEKYTHVEGTPEPWGVR